MPEYELTLPAGCGCCGSSSSSSSSGSSSSGSHGSGSTGSGEPYCYHRFRTTWNCETQQWSAVTRIDSNCGMYGGLTEAWSKTATNGPICTYERLVKNGACSSYVDGCTTPNNLETPNAPAPPATAFDCCGSTSTSTSHGSTGSGSTGSNGSNGSNPPVDPSGPTGSNGSGSTSHSRSGSTSGSTSGSGSTGSGSGGSTPDPNQPYCYSKWTAYFNCEQQTWEGPFHASSECHNPNVVVPPLQLEWKYDGMQVSNNALSHKCKYWVLTKTDRKCATGGEPCTGYNDTNPPALPDGHDCPCKDGSDGSNDGSNDGSTNPPMMMAQEPAVVEPPKEEEEPKRKTPEEYRKMRDQIMAKQIRKRDELLAKQKREAQSDQKQSDALAKQQQQDIVDRKLSVRDQLLAKQRAMRAEVLAKQAKMRTEMATRKPCNCGKK